MDTTPAQMTHIPDPATPGAAAPGRLAAFEDAARALEASFLAEMLRLSGVGRPPDSVSGGPGEEAFAGYLADAYAEKLAASGGIGLAEHIVAALLARDAAAGGAG